MRTTTLAPFVAAVLAAAAVTAADLPRLPDSPDGTVATVAAAVADGHPEIVWHAMPPSWQDDVTSLTHEFAAAMDAAVYDGMFDLTRRAIRVARAKKPLLMESGMLDRVGPGSDAVASSYDQVLDVLEVIATSDLATLEGLAQLEWPAFLRTTGGSLMAKLEAASEGSDEPSPIESLRGLKAETLSRDGDTASVRISVPGETPETVPMTRVEGRWVPADLAADWDADVEQARAALASQKEDETARAQTKNQMMMVLASANAVLDQVEAASTPEELQAVVGGVLGSLGGALALGAAAQSPDVPPAGD